ncbi:unnamed protein product [Rotaria sp. Silwood1]|nr:unnamed protein product [Rotaria sp. Silwood1]
MKFDTTANSAYAYNEWIKQKVQFVNGGQEWNCTNSTTRKAIVIMMKLIPSTFKLTKNQIIVNTTNDTNITPLVCFDDLRINMTTGQEIPKPANAVRNTSNMTTTTTTLPVTTPSATTMTTTIPIMTQTTSLNLTTTRMRSNQTLRASCSIFSSIDSSTLTLVRQPSVDATYQLGTTFYLSWTLNSDFDTSISLEIKLKRSGLLGIPTDIYTWYVPAGRYFFSVTISSLPISTRESYYFSFYWINVYRCVSIPHWKTTNSFRIPTAPYITVYGGYRSTYFPGDTIHVQWMVTNGAFPSGAQVLLRFNRYRWLISDDTVASVWVNPSNYYYDYTIPINLPKEDNDDEYYFRLDWYSSSWISITDTYTSDSNHFYVPTKPIIVPLLPATDDSYTVTDTVKITWTARNFDSTSSNYLTITLKRYRLLLWDETIYTVASCSNPQSELCFDGQLSQVQPSVSDFYYHFSWCGWWPFSCYKNGFYFLIPVHVTDGWNYNPALGKAISQKTIYHADCSSKPTGVVGKLCNESRKMSIDLTCANCYLSYDYSILRLDLIASGGVLGNMNIKFKSTATVNIELLLEVNYLYQKQDLIPLAQLTLSGFSFRISSISFRFGYFLDIDLPYTVELNAIGSLSGGLQYVMNINLALYVVGTSASHTIDMSLTKKNYPIQGNLKANLIVDVALRPTLRMDAIIFSVALTTEGYLRYENLFQYPPFPGGSINYDYDVFNPSIYHYSYPSDACSTPHLLRYHIQFGIRNSRLTFDVKLDQISSYISTAVNIHHALQIFEYEPVYELVSGCFFQVPYNDYIQSAGLYLDIPYNGSSVFSEYFKTSIIFDMAKVLNTAPARILYNLSQPYFYQALRRTITYVSLSILPYVMPSNTDPNVRELADRLLANELNPSSVLYTDTIWAKKLVNSLTQQSNNITGIITTTTTTTTTTPGLTAPSKNSDVLNSTFDRQS